MWAARVLEQIVPTSSLEAEYSRATRRMDGVMEMSQLELPELSKAVLDRTTQRGMVSMVTGC